ncbi:MAG: hypothetical protein ACOC5T_10395 [Elusimicrobiota bacterium]
MKSEKEIRELLEMRIEDHNSYMEAGLIQRAAEINRQIEDILWILDEK